VEPGPRGCGLPPHPMPQSNRRLVISSHVVLLTDAGERSTLAAARSLRLAGCSVHVAAYGRRSLTGAASGVTTHIVPTPADHPNEFVAGLAGIVRRNAISCLLPMTDHSMEAVLKGRSMLAEDLRVIAPSPSAYQLASNKADLMDLASEAGFAIPETVRIDTLDGADLPDPGFFPAVLKPHRSVVATGTGQRTLAVSMVQDRDECWRQLKALPTEAYPVLLQQRIVGPGEGYFALRWGGKIIAHFSHRRLREKPPSGGVSVYRESIRLDSALVDAGTRLLELLDWEGVIMIECKRDLTTDRPVVMEANGRFWGSLQLAIDAGVDFPAMLVRCAMGEDVRPVTKYREGIRSRWLWGDLDHLYMRLRYSPQALNLPPDAPSRLTAIGRFLRVFPGRDRLEVFRWSDPGPMLAETLARMGLSG
jgi:predicted ATP-grasp superfamily ATP-dependent carboligase